MNPIAIFETSVERFNNSTGYTKCRQSHLCHRNDINICSFFPEGTRATKAVSHSKCLLMIIDFCTTWGFPACFWLLWLLVLVQSPAGKTLGLNIIQVLGAV